MAVRYVTVHLQVGEPELGLWCGICALPSKVAFPVYALSEFGVKRVGTVIRCYEELERDHADPDPA